MFISNQFFLYLKMATDVCVCVWLCVGECARDVREGRYSRMHDRDNAHHITHNAMRFMYYELKCRNKLEFDRDWVEKCK